MAATRTPIRPSKKSRSARLLAESLEPRLLMAADLTGSLILTNPGSLAPGASLSFLYAVSNIDSVTKATGTATLAFYTSTDSILNTSAAISLGTTSLSINLNPNATTLPPKSIKFNLPASAVAGTYHMFMVVNSTHAITEASETNNTATAISTITVTQPDYDLTAAFVSSNVPPAIVTGNTAKGNINITISNTGTVTTPSANPPHIEIFLRPSSGDDINITPKFSTAASVATNKPKPLSIPVAIPASLAPGTYTVIIKTDSTNLLAETHEDNNDIVTASQLVVADPFIDLTAAIDNVKSIIPAAALLNAGPKENLILTITNHGNSATTGTQKISIKLTATEANDSTHTPIDVQTFTNISLANLKPGATSTPITLAATLPTAFAAGTYTLTATIDSDNAITESHEDNNTATAASATTLDTAFVKLANSITTSTLPAAFFTGADVKANVTVKTLNLGNVASNPTGKIDVALALRPLGGTAADDIIIGSKTNVPFAKLASLTGSATTTVQVTVPAAFTAGTYQLVTEVTPHDVAADTRNTVATWPTNIVITRGFVSLTNSITTTNLPPAIVSGTTASGSVSVHIVNTGNISPAATAKADITIKLRPTAGGDDIPIGTKLAVSLASLKTSPTGTTVPVPVSILSTLIAADYTLVAIITPTIATDDNNSPTGPAFSSHAAFVDLSIDSASTTFGASANAAATGTGKVTLKNLGNSKATGSVTITFYATISGTDTAIGHTTLASTSLNANATSPQISVALTLPDVIASATYTLSTKATYTNIADNNAANDTKSLSDITVNLVPGPLGLWGNTITITSVDSFDPGVATPQGRTAVTKVHFIDSKSQVGTIDINQYFGLIAAGFDATFTFSVHPNPGIGIVTLKGAHVTDLIVVGTIFTFGSGPINVVGDSYSSAPTKVTRTN